MRTSRISFAVAIAGLAASGSAFGQDQKISRADLPAAVARTVDEQVKGATVRGFTREREAGHTYYEAELTVNGHSKDVLMDSTGAVVEVEEQVEMSTLPAAVQAGLTAKAGGGTITRVESITRHGVLVAYEAKVTRNGKRSEVQVGPDGKALDHEE